MTLINMHIADDQAMVVELLIPVINASGFASVSGYLLRLSECRKTLTLNARKEGLITEQSINP